RIHPAQFPPTRSIPQIHLRQLPPGVASLHSAQYHRRVPRHLFRFHSQHARARLTRHDRFHTCTRPARRPTQRPWRKRRHSSRRHTSPETPRRSLFRPRLHRRLRRRHRCFRQLHRKLRTVFRSCHLRRFPLRFLFSVAPRHFPKRFLARRALAGLLRLFLFLLCRINLARRDLGLILRCEDLRALQIVFGINVVGTLRLRGLTRLLLPRRFGRILRPQTARAKQPRQQKSHSAAEERSSTSLQGARDRCVQPHRLALARVVLHIPGGQDRPTG